MEKAEHEALLKQYAFGDVRWNELRERGFDDYVQVLGGLGALGLRPPVAPMEGPNREARARTRHDPRGVADAPMSGPFNLIVTDTSPPLTFALADSLDALLSRPRPFYL